MKRHPTEWKKIPANDISDKGLRSKIYKELKQLRIKKDNLIKNGQRTSTAVSLQKTYRCREKFTTTGPQGAASKARVSMAVTKRKTRAGEDAEKREPSYIANWCIHYRKQYGGSSKKLKIKLPCDIAIPILGIFLKKTKSMIQKDTCTPMYCSIIYNSQDIEATSASVNS